MAAKKKISTMPANFLIKLQAARIKIHNHSTRQPAEPAQDEPSFFCNPTPLPLVHSFHSEEEEEEEEEQHLLTSKTIPSHNTTPSSTTSAASSYSLTFGPLSTPRTLHYPSNNETITPLTLASPSPSRGTTSTSLHEINFRKPMHPFDHIKILLSQFASSITSSKAAFSLIRASTRSVCSFVDVAYNKAEKSMGEELERLSDIRLKLYCLVQQERVSLREDSPHHTSSIESTGLNCNGSEKRQGMMLKAYEGIIVKLHDEINKKDAVTEALKETLAKSILKGEKLERRMKALESKLSSMQPKQA